MQYEVRNPLPSSLRLLSRYFLMYYSESTITPPVVPVHESDNTGAVEKYQERREDSSTPVLPHYRQ